MSFRDSAVVIIETARTRVKGGLGLYELLKKPTVDILARVALRKNASGEYLNKAQQPITNENGVEHPAPRTTSKSHASSLPFQSVPGAAVHDYLVGDAIEEAITTGQDLMISWPFAEGTIRDFTQAEALWKHVLFQQLHLRRAQNESPVLLSLFPGMARDSYERTCQIFFERFNAAGLGIVERPIAQLYAANSLNGMVIDIDEEKTDITPISDSFVQQYARTTISLGLSDCQNYLAHLLRTNQSVVNAFSPPTAPLEPEALHSILLDLVKQLCTDDQVKIPSDGETAAPEDEGVTDIAAIVVAGKEKAVIESGMKKKATAKASAAEQARAREIEALDLITVQFRGQALTLGKERHRLCEPLFDPTLLRGVPGTNYLGSDTDRPLSLQEAVGLAVSQCEVDQRQSIWSGLFVTGDITRHVRGIGVALQSRVAPWVVNPDVQSDVQPRYVRNLNVPEYYAEYRDTGNGLASFLGASITAKITFINDTGSKNFVAKGDYTARGPRSIIEMSPALL